MAERSEFRVARNEGPVPATTPSSRSTQSAAKATALTIGLVLVSRVLGVLRDILLSYIFGQNGETSIYRAAFRVPDLIALVIAGGGLSAVFIPVFAGYWNDNREEDAWQVFGTVMNIVMLVVAVLVAIMEIGVLPLTHLLQHSFLPDEIARTAALSRILLPAQWFLIVGGFMMGTLYARKRFLIPALGPVVYNLGTIVGALTQLGSHHPQMSAMAWGTSIGAIGGSFVLPVVELLRIGVKWRPRLMMQHEGVQRVGRLMLPVLLGLSLGQLIMWITGGCLPVDERLSALTTAYNLTQAPIGIFAQAFAIVLLPTISNLAAEERWPDFRKALSQGIRRVLFLTIPASLLMSVLALPLIRVMYEHGPKFTDENAHLAAQALLYYSLGTFAWSGLAILARGFYARQETWTPLFITTPMVLVFYILVQISLYLDPDGLIGIALSASIVGILTMLFFLYYLQKSVGHLNVVNILFAVLRTLIASVVASLAAYLVTNAIDAVLGHGRFLNSAINLVVSGIVGIGLYWFVSLLFRSPELKSVGEMFRRRAGATAPPPSP